MQVARRSFGIPAEPFSLIIGSMFFLGGLWQLFGLHVGRSPLPTSVVPILFIIAGGLLLYSAIRRRPVETPR